ncbi:MAG TPA: hypothetical protein VJH71_02510 [Candidatus Paceibacterota bacterium]
MAESVGQSGSSNLEQEIAQIERDLASKRADLEFQQQSGQIQEIPKEKETLREVVQEQYSMPVQKQTPQNDQSSSGQAIPPTVEPPSYLAPELKDKVQELVNIAFNQSPGEAIKQAKASNNAALIDAFHDALVDELYNHLLERGKIQRL